MTFPALSEGTVSPINRGHHAGRVLVGCETGTTSATQRIHSHSLLVETASGPWPVLSGQRPVRRLTFSWSKFLGPFSCKAFFSSDPWASYLSGFAPGSVE